MTCLEHYFENLLLHGEDVANNANKNALTEDEREAVEYCAQYVIYVLFGNRKNFEKWLKEEENNASNIDAIPVKCGEWMDVIPVVLCKDCKWWIPHGKETPASIPALGECQFKDRKFGTGCWEFCFWGEREDDA